MPCDMESMEDWSAGVEVEVEVDGGEAVVRSVRWRRGRGRGWIFFLNDNKARFDDSGVKRFRGGAAVK